MNLQHRFFEHLPLSRDLSFQIFDFLFLKIKLYRTRGFIRVTFLTLLNVMLAVKKFSQRFLFPLKVVVYGRKRQFALFCKFGRTALLLVV